MRGFDLLNERLQLANRAGALNVAKTGLAVWGATSLAALGVGLALYASGAWDPLGPAAGGAETTRTASAEPTARLPRPRPTAPVQTASIVRHAQPATAAGGTAPIQHVAARPIGYAMRPEPADGDFGISHLIQRHASAVLDDGAAVRACEDKVRVGLPRPATMHRSLSSTGIYRGAGDDPVVMFDFDAINGMGFPLVQQVQCVFDGTAIARLEVGPR